MMSDLKKFYYFISFFLVIGLSWVSWNFIRVQQSKPGIEICVLKKTVGIACPSCGTTRSIMHLLHGDVLNAALFNPLGLLVSPGLFLLPFWLFYDYWNSKRTLWAVYLQLTSILQNKKFSLLVLILILLNWYWNIQKGI